MFLRVLGKCAMMLLLSSSMAIAQAGGPAKPAELQLVVKGVFSLEAGKSVDLTDRGILLRFIQVERSAAGEPPKIVRIAINGDQLTPNIGHRYNLKNSSRTEEFVKDIDVCMLDVVDAVWPKGGTATATFRLMCP